MAHDPFEVLWPWASSPIQNLDNVELDNSGKCALKVPGVEGIDLDAEMSPRRQFLNGLTWEMVPRCTAREAAMIQLMNQITDRPEWYLEVFDNSAVLKLADFAKRFNQLISDKAWTWCLEELRLKATKFEQTGRVLALDAGNSVCKWDYPIGTSTHDRLRKGLTNLRESYISKRKVQQLIDPSLYPLVFGETPALLDGGCVHREQMLAKYETAQPFPIPHLSFQRPTFDMVINHHEITGMHFHHSWVKDWFLWSYVGQWLPCEVEFKGKDGAPRITSYINNLHPKQYSYLYNALQDLMGPTISAWDDVLNKNGHGTSPLRIRTFGFEQESQERPVLIDQIVDFEKSLPTTLTERNVSIVQYDKSSSDYARLCGELEEFLQLPEPDDGLRMHSYESEIPVHWEDDLSWAVRAKWHNLERAAHPEPGTAFSFEDWKHGRNGECIVPRQDGHSDENVHHVSEPISLRDAFGQSGLQIIVKATSIELNPGKRFAGDDVWQANVLSNEHIAATAIYFIEHENVTETFIRFRQYSPCHQTQYRTGRAPQTFRRIFDIPEDADDQNPEEYHVLGSIKIDQGRLIAFPTPLEHQFLPFRLIDDSLPGRLSFVTLLLVDPHWRIASTLNVPAQQPESSSKHDLIKLLLEVLGQRLPVELICAIADELEGWDRPEYEAIDRKWWIDQERILASKAKDLIMRLPTIDI